MEQLVNSRLREDMKAVVIVDQTALPGSLEYLELETFEQMERAIKLLQVRGAPALGVFAGYALFVLANRMGECETFHTRFAELSSRLAAARPTAVNLSWACRRMEKAIEGEDDAAKCIELLKKEAAAIYEEDAAMCTAISKYGMSLLRDGMGILTHCNAGPLATSIYGTALGPLIMAAENGIDIKVYADETRPLLQGARLTSYELDRAGVDVTLMCDNMASWAMKQGLIQACFVGCDRVAMNGDAANKIGTSGVAILAKHYGIPFYVLGPTSTIDPNCKSGEDIPIEMRSADEIKTMFYEKPMAPEGVKCINPAFDVTDHTLITGIITEKGIATAPFEESLAKMLEK